MRDALAPEQPPDLAVVDLAKAVVRGPGANDGPGERPAGGVEQRQDGKVLCARHRFGVRQLKPGLNHVCKGGKVNAAVGILDSLSTLPLLPINTGVFRSAGEHMGWGGLGEGGTLGLAVVPLV